MDRRYFFIKNFVFCFEKGLVLDKENIDTEKNWVASYWMMDGSPHDTYKKDFKDTMNTLKVVHDTFMACGKILKADFVSFKAISESKEKAFKMGFKIFKLPDHKIDEYFFIQIEENPELS